MESNSSLTSVLITLCIIAVVFVVAYQALVRHAQAKASSVGLQERTVLWNGNLLESYRVEWIPRPKTVDFDPAKTEHLAAYHLMIGRGRDSRTQHPTLRFNFDPTHHDNVYDMMREAFVEFYMPADAKHRAMSMYQERFYPAGRKVIVLSESQMNSRNKLLNIVEKISTAQPVTDSPHQITNFLRKINASNA